MDSEIQKMQREFAGWIQLSWESVGREGPAPADFLWPDALEWIKKKALSLVERTPEQLSQYGWYPSPPRSDRSTSPSQSLPLRKHGFLPPPEDRGEEIVTDHAHQHEHEQEQARIDEAEAKCHVFHRREHIVEQERMQTFQAPETTTQ